MGGPVKILDLATRFAKLNGCEPGVGIDIQLTGVRPGEKLFETLAYDGEAMAPTSHEAIRIWRMAPPDQPTMVRIASTLDGLRDPGRDGRYLWSSASREAIIHALHSAIPEMVRAAAAG